MNSRLVFILLISTQLFCVNGRAQNPIFKVAPSYLSKHDIVYQTPAYEGFEGFPLGNGDLGGMLWNTNNGIEVQLNKNDLFDQSHEENRATPRGGILVSSEQKKNGTIPGVYIKSSKGNQCKLENPWPGKEITVFTYTGKEINVNFKIVNKNIIVFDTEADKGYLICQKSTKDALICTLYEGQKNQAPKRFFESSLGKSVNY